MHWKANLVQSLRIIAAVAVLGIAHLVAHSQALAVSAQLAQTTPSSATRRITPKKTAVPAAAPAATVPSSSVKDSAACPPALSQGDIQRINDAAAAVQAAAKDLKKNDSFWSSVFVNVFSNRLDSFLFGKSPENRGLVALITSWLALAAAIVKLLLALKLPGSGLSSRSFGRRIVEVVLSLILCFTATLSVLAVQSARTAANAAIQPNESIQRNEEVIAALAACTSSLREARAPQPGATSTAMLESIKRVETACIGARNDSAAKLARLQQRTDDIYDSRIGFFSKMFIFFGFLGVAYLVVKSIKG